MTVRAVMIGVGGIARGKYFPALRQLPEVQLVGFSDVVLARAEEAAALYGAPGAVAAADYRAILDLPADVAFVLTPNRHHAEETVAALESGKHVMCEKPMATTVADAESMVATAERVGRVLTIGYQNRFRADVQYLKSLCGAGDLGQIYFAKALAVRRRGVPTWGTFLSREAQGGGPLIDIGTHAVDLALWLMDNYAPRNVMGSTYQYLGRQGSAANRWGPWDPAQFTVEDAAFGMVQMQDGATLLIESSWALNTLQEAEAQVTLSGTIGGAEMGGGLRLTGERAGRLFTMEPEFSQSEGGWEDACTANVRNFIRAVTNEEALVVLPRQALVVTQVLDALYRSAETARPVAWDAGALAL